MTRFLKNLTFLLITTSILASAKAENGENNFLSEQVNGNNTFALELYGKLKSRDGNICFSPYSISTAFAMAYAGAHGETERQIAQVLHFNSDQSKLHSLFGELQKKLTSAEQQKGIDLHMANILWTQKGHPFLPSFLEHATNYETSIKQVDFATQSEAARQQINGWAGQQTRGTITNILAEGELDSLTSLVLVNVLYLNSHWEVPFDAKETKTAAFHLADGRTKDVQMMHQKNKHRYHFFEDDTVQLVELSYTNYKLSMLILLPKDVNGLAKLEAAVNTKSLSKWEHDAEYLEVELFLPRFKFESGLELAPELKKLGIMDAFTGVANFSGIDGTKMLRISTALHKSFVKVDEQGTEASFITRLAYTAQSMVEHVGPAILRADHPFIFLVRDCGTGSILFMGRVMDPGN